MTRIIWLLTATVMFAEVSVLGERAPGSFAQHATPETSTPVVTSSEVLGRAIPVPVTDPVLALGRVTIMPGAAIPAHYPPGTQIGVVVQGELTFEVFRGEVAWHRTGDSGAEPTLIGPGETVVVRAGEALVETPGSIHQGRNAGDVPVVIYLSTLFPADAPGSIVVEATPVT